VERTPAHIYLDPVDAIWLTVADRIGFRVVRSKEAYASTDGRGTMVIGASDTLDADDCLAQMILHELCHSIIEGEHSLALPDFGLDNQGSADTTREHACLRLQAWLSDRHGLREVLAPTTDFRSYYEQLPKDPIADDGPAAAAAREGARRSEGPPWAPHLQHGLRATAQVIDAVRALAARDPNNPAPPIWARKRGLFPFPKG
jgi:hypothetical protein